MAAPANLDQNLLMRQLRHELEEEHSKVLEGREKKISELSATVEKLNYERQIEREKAALKTNALEAELRESQQRHEVLLPKSRAKYWNTRTNYSSRNSSAPPTTSSCCDAQSAKTKSCGRSWN